MEPFVWPACGRMGAGALAPRLDAAPSGRRVAIRVHDGVVGSRHGRLAVGGLNWESGRTMGGKAHARSRPWSDWFACSFTERSAATILCYAPGWRDCFGSNAGVAASMQLGCSCEGST